MMKIDVNQEMNNYYHLIEKVIMGEYRATLSYVEYDDLTSIGLEGLWIGVKSYNAQVSKEAHYYNNIKLKISNYLSNQINKNNRKGRSDVTVLSSTKEDMSDYEYASMYSMDNELDYYDLLEQLKVLLDERQYRIVELLESGFNQREISEILEISQQLVSRNVKKIREILKANKIGVE